MPKTGYKQTEEHKNKTKRFSGKKHNEETKKKMSETRKTIWSDPKTKKRLSEKMTGVPKSEQGRMNMIGKVGGHIQSEKGKLAIAKASLKKWQDIQWKEKRRKEMSLLSKKLWSEGKLDHLKQGRGKGGLHKGIWMRSSWEIEFSKKLDKANFAWQYEPKRFILSSGRSYRPDFLLTDLKVWIEVKGYWQEKAREKFNLFKKENPTEAIITVEEKIWELPLKCFMDILLMKIEKQKLTQDLLKKN